jgi:uncharacterized protein YbjT (DUF2867 family)
MRKVLILGAGGQVARHVIEWLANNNALDLTLYLRDASRLKRYDGPGIKVVEGDILDATKLAEAVRGQDIVYVNISGSEDVLAEHIVKAMQSTGVKRLVFIAAIGIYDEVAGAFGQWNEQMIGPYIARYKKAAVFIEASGLDYTILRPTWYTDKDEVDYVLTQKGEPITRTEISRKSVADFIVKVIENPAWHMRKSIGLEKPGTEGEKPAFMQ